jgi:hypothetical protein
MKRRHLVLMKRRSENFLDDFRFLENPTKRLIFYLFYYYSQKKISLTKYL